MAVLKERQHVQPGFVNSRARDYDAMPSQTLEQR